MPRLQRNDRLDEMEFSFAVQVLEADACILIERGLRLLLLLSSVGNVFSQLSYCICRA